MTSRQRRKSQALPPGPCHPRRIHLIESRMNSNRHEWNPVTRGRHRYDAFVPAAPLYFLLLQFTKKRDFVGDISTWKRVQYPPPVFSWNSWKQLKLTLNKFLDCCSCKSVCLIDDEAVTDTFWNRNEKLVRSYSNQPIHQLWLTNELTPTPSSYPTNLSPQTKLKQRKHLAVKSHFPVLFQHRKLDVLHSLLLSSEANLGSSPTTIPILSLR